MLNAEKLEHDRLTKLDLIDVLGLDFGLDQKVVRLGHDQHNRIAGRDHAANRIRGRLENDTILRRAESVRHELILRSHLSLDIFSDLAVGLAQLFADVAGEFLIDLENLQLGLDDLALDLGRGGDELAVFALQARLLAFKRREPADLNQVSGPQIADALKLLGDNGHFFGLGILLGRQPDNLLLQLLDTLLQLIFLSEARLAAQFEQLALAAKGFLHVGIVGFVRELLRHLDRLGAVPFGARRALRA